MSSSIVDVSEVGLGDKEGGEASRERLTMAVRESFTCYRVTKKDIIAPQIGCPYVSSFFSKLLIPKQTASANLRIHITDRKHTQYGHHHVSFQKAFGFNGFTTVKPSRLQNIFKPSRLQNIFKLSRLQNIYDSRGDPFSPTIAIINCEMFKAPLTYSSFIFPSPGEGIPSERILFDRTKIPHRE